MTWHKTSVGDYPEDHKEKIGNSLNITVLAYTGEYIVVNREFNDLFKAWYWKGTDKKIIAWSYIETYK